MRSRREQYEELRAANSLKEILSYRTNHNFMGFNGQIIRATIIRKMANVSKGTVFVETGAAYGASTICAHRYLCLPVYSCEISLKNFIISRIMTLNMKAIKIYRSSSPMFLRRLCNMDLLSECPIFYLDAHGGAHGKEYLPLLDEISIIAELDQFVVIIDDCRVPHEDNFGYDVYDGIAIDIDFMQRALRGKKINKIYFPNYSADLDTGFCRGYCVFWRSRELDRAHSRGDFSLNLLSSYELK